MSEALVLLVADPADAELCGIEGAFPFGTVVAAGGDPGERGPDLVVAVGDAPLPDEAAGAPRLRLLDREPTPEEARGARVVAPAGEGLWARQPWPAADGLFGMPESDEPRLTVTGADAGRREELVAAAHARGLAVESCAALDRSALERSSVVAFADACAGALPARAMSVLAAGRVLLAPRAAPSFGLQAGLDHVGFREIDEGLNLAESALSYGRAFERIRAGGVLAAERHRASVVYGRMLTDVQLTR